MILLNNKQILEAINSRVGKRSTVISLSEERISEFRASNKAQLKRIMLWLEIERNKCGVSWRKLTAEDCEALLKEADND